MKISYHISPRLATGNLQPEKSPKRRPRWKKRGDFEEAPRLAGMIVTGNRLARQWYHR
ncbi:MAG: hypothetical protein ACLUIC_09535 [Oscillospiraceae bacterium]|jgi:hypothetical protein